MSNDTQQIVESMRARFRALKQQREAALETAENIYEEMKRVRVAWLALTGQESPDMKASVSPERHAADAAVVAAAPSSSKNRTPKNPPLSPERFHEALMETLSDGPIVLDDLKTKIRDIANGEGCHAKGLHFRIKKHLTERMEFTEETEGWTLAGLFRYTANVSRILGKDGALTEPQIWDKIQVSDSASASRERLKRALIDGPFSFDGARWTVPTA